jgi:FtsP/CotA-like multicopper oxidase with cupredoxin domain
MIAFVVLFAAAAHAQTTTEAGNCNFDQPLIEPQVLTAKAGRLETTLTLRMATALIPAWLNVAPFGEPPVYRCSMTKLKLRRYSWPGPDGKERSGIPGPTLRLRKAASPLTTGEGLTVHLVNELPVAPNDECNAGCDCTNPDSQPQCCKAADVFPACFHGDNNTNLHFHGTHVSPQPPQDYVLLELRPKGSALDHNATHVHGDVAVGKYDYVVDPFRYNQPEGTHWYHPHKHGSTAIQVGNGLAGALLIEGKFDDDLRALFNGALKEHVLVVQMVQDLNFTSVSAATPQPLVNGQPSPVIDMYPGEIRRLRLIAAVVQGNGALTVDFNGAKNNGVEAMQVSMDGVQFAPENYARQPMMNGAAIDIAPGNRADILVRAPMKAGTYDVTYDVRANQELKPLIAQLERDDAQPRLFRIRVSPCRQIKTCVPMSFPKVSDFPKMPDFLADIPERSIEARRTLFFELANATGTVPPDQIPSQPSKFFINLKAGEKRQFDPTCIDITSRLGETQQWEISNTSKRAPIAPLHIFHIHTNAFQVINHPLRPKMNTPPYVWMDSILLPDSTQGAITIRHTFHDFTGAYVLHCHFLGHEDRGMMLGVQVICPDATRKFGTAIAGSPDDCRPPAQINSLPSCAGDVADRRPGASHQH